MTFNEHENKEIIKEFFARAEFVNLDKPMKEAILKALNDRGLGFHNYRFNSGKLLIDGFEKTEQFLIKLLVDALLETQATDKTKTIRELAKEIAENLRKAKGDGEKLE
jgi:hypothetical protein